MCIAIITLGVSIVFCAVLSNRLLGQIYPDPDEAGRLAGTIYSIELATILASVVGVAIAIVGSMACVAMRISNRGNKEERKKEWKERSC